MSSLMYLNYDTIYLTKITGKTANIKLYLIEKTRNFSNLK